MKPLYGTLETVVLEKVHREPDTASGTIIRNGQRIYVSNGVPFLGQEMQHVLVRTDTGLAVSGDPFRDNPRFLAQTGNYVASEIPPEMIAMGFLGPREYILMGIFPWQDGPPSLEDINELYDPGRMGYAEYFPSGSLEGMGIHPKQVSTYAGGYPEAIDRQLQKGIAKNSRVILVGSAGQIPELEHTIRDKGLIPVRMDSLRRTVSLQH